MPSSFAARQHSVATWTVAVSAATRPSLSTPAGPGTVQSAKPTLATSGSPDAARNCCRSCGYRYHQLTLRLTAGLEQNRFSERLIRPPHDGEVILYGQRPTLYHIVLHI